MKTLRFSRGNREGVRWFGEILPESFFISMTFRKHDSDDEKSDRRFRFMMLRNVGMSRNSSIKSRDWNDSKIQMILEKKALLYNREEIKMKIEKSKIVGSDSYYLYLERRRNKSESNLFGSSSRYMYIETGGIVKIPDEIIGKKFRLKVEFVDIS
jgi:hypothetical protein